MRVLPYRTRSRRQPLRSAAFTGSGRSMVDRCPQSGTTTSREPAMPPAISRASSGGVNSSPSPTSTSVGQPISDSSGRESWRDMIAFCCRTKASGPVSAAIARTVVISAASLRRLL